jgi:PAS domain-containing protein
MQNDDGREAEGERGDAMDWRLLQSCEQLLDLVSDRVFAFDSELRVVRTNAAFDSAFGGGDPGLLLGRSFGDVVACRWAEKGACGASEACRLCGWFSAADEVRLGAGSTQECRILTGSGDAYDFAVHVAPAVAGGCGVCALRDLHAHKRLRVLERSVFHDVINLAIGVKGLTEMFDISDRAQTEEYVRLIHDSAEKMVDEILRLRTLRSAESGDLTVCCGAVSARELLETVASRYEEASSARRLEVPVAGGDELSFETDRELALMVLGALMSNAVEASTRGCRVSLGYLQEGSSVVLFIRNAQLLPDEVRLQMFERSFSTKGAGKGVGTYGAKLITERYLGGQVWFESRPPEGTTFYVRLPAASAG